MKRSQYFLWPAIALLFACQSEPDNLKLFDQLVVSTNYDTTAAFNSYTTYAISTDTIGFYSSNSNDTILVQSSSTNYPRPVLQQVQKNLDALGYTRVAKQDDPDIGINVYVVNDLNLFQQVNYPSYYYPYYYGYNPYYYYYPYISTYAYNTGALVVEVVDLRDVTPDNKVKVVWTAYMGDVYSTVDLVQQSLDAIDQAFVQSPYLDK